MSTAGDFSEYSIPTPDSEPGFIAAGPDGNVWFTEERGGKVAKVTTSGAITEYAVPTDTAPFPWGITAGPDGNMWFTEDLGNKVAKVTMAGVITEYTLPTPGSEPTEIAAGPDGNLWFTEGTSNHVGPGKVARVTTSGVVTEFTFPRSLDCSLCLISVPRASLPARMEIYGSPRRLAIGWPP